MKKTPVTYDHIKEVLKNDLLIAASSDGNKLTYCPYDLHYRVTINHELIHSGTNPELALKIYNQHMTYKNEQLARNLSEVLKNR